MEYANILGLDKPVSRIVQGTTVIRPKDDASIALLDSVYEQGCNTFDTGRVYGDNNERTVANWITSRGIRDKVVYIAKGAHHNGLRRRVTPWDITADIYDTLACTGFDYLDLYLLHRDDQTFPVGPLVDCLNDHMEAGRIRAFGGSNWSHFRIQEANNYAKMYGMQGFSASSPNYSLAEQYDEPWAECVTISGAAGKPAREFYEKSQFPLFTWSSLAGGFLTGAFTETSLKENEMLNRCYGRPDNWERIRRCEVLGKERGLSVAQMATAYVFSRPLNLFGLIASRSGDEFKQNLTALNTKLTPVECAWLNLEVDAR